MYTVFRKKIIHLFSNFTIFDKFSETLSADSELSTGGHVNLMQSINNKIGYARTRTRNNNNVWPIATDSSNNASPRYGI